MSDTFEQKMREIEKYLSKKEIKNILQTELKNMFKEIIKNRKDLNVILSNMSYYAVFEAIDELHDKKFTENLTKQIHKVISELTERSVFRTEGFSGDNERSRILLQAVKDHIPLINTKLEKIISDFNSDDFSLNLNSKIEDALMKRLFGKE